MNAKTGMHSALHVHSKGLVIFLTGYEQPERVLQVYLSCFRGVSGFDIADLEVLKEGVLVSSTFQGGLLEGNGKIPLCCGIPGRQPHQLIAL